MTYLYKILAMSHRNNGACVAENTHLGVNLHNATAPFVENTIIRFVAIARMHKN